MQDNKYYMIGQNSISKNESSSFFWNLLFE